MRGGGGTPKGAQDRHAAKRARPARPHVLQREEAREEEEEGTDVGPRQHAALEAEGWDEEDALAAGTPHPRKTRPRHHHNDQEEEEGHGAMEAGTAAKRRRTEEHAWEAKWPVYGLAWAQASYGPTRPLRLAISSLLEDRYSNHLAVVDYDPKRGDLAVRAEVAHGHGYAATKLLWRPEDLTTGDSDLLATSGEYLRLWRVPTEGDVQIRPHTEPDWRRRGAITSFDWCVFEPNLIAAAHVNGSVALWDISSSQRVDDLIAHEGKVYDVAFNQASGGRFLATASADGSVRLWDRRNRFEKGILLFDSDRQGFFRAAWGSTNENFIAVVPLRSQTPFIMDMRCIGAVVSRLSGHTGSVNALTWSPYPETSEQLLTGGDDRKLHMWSFDPSIRDLVPQREMQAAHEINNVSWCAQEPYAALAQGRSLLVFPL